MWVWAQLCCLVELEEPNNGVAEVGPVGEVVPQPVGHPLTWPHVGWPAQHQPALTYMQCACICTVNTYFLTFAMSNLLGETSLYFVKCIFYDLFYCTSTTCIFYSINVLKNMGKKAWKTKTKSFFFEVWWSRGSVHCPCLWAARPGFESRPGASPQCVLRSGRSHCYTV